MKKHLGKLVVCGALLMLSGPLLAQSHDRGHDDHDRNDHGRSDHRDDHHYQGMHDRGRHEGWYKKGGHMPSEYRGSRYVVTDWRHDHLREPPRGYHWVRSDNGDFLLVAVATGIIADILAHQ